MTVTANKPNEASRKYNIRGTKKPKPSWIAMQKVQNAEYRTRRCICCLQVRKPRSYPVCDPCITRHHRED